MKSISALILLFLSLPVFAKQKEPISVNINAPEQAIKIAAVQVASANGYTISQEGTFQIVFAKNITGAAGFFTSALSSPPACSSISPRFILAFVFAGSALTASMETEHAGPLCQPVRESFDGKNVRANIEGLLQQIKTRAESISTSAPAPSKELIENSAAGKGSPAAANALANGHTETPEQMLELVKQGKASRAAVVTNPPGAQVFIDGRLAGKTPITFFLFREETPRIITVKMDGYQPIEQSVVPDGKTIPIGLDLVKQ